MIHCISVVRDVKMYDRLVVHNPCVADCKLTMIDNRETNRSITSRYNEYLSAAKYADGDWLVFCHEDFEFLEPLKEKLERLNLNPMAVYGIAGLDFDYRSQGCTLNSQKDGSGITVAGFPFAEPKLVAVVDCMCLIVSAELIKKTGLRFDENLSFDLYAEDFCIHAKEKFGIDSYVLPIRTQHYSWGVVGDRFIKQYRYLCKKYQDAKRAYYTTLARRIGGGCCDVQVYAPPCRRQYVFGIFLKSMTADGYCVWSIFRYKLRFWKTRIIDPYEWKKANPNTIYPPEGLKR